MPSPFETPATARHGLVSVASRSSARVLPFVSGADLAARMLASPPLAPNAAVHAAVAEALTIRETSFFRSPAMLRMIGDRILPEMIDRNRHRRKLRIWSAGCATGQEVYSLAMLLCDGFPELAEWDVQVVGTDISEQAIAYGKRGRYSRGEVNRGLPAQGLLKYFEREGDAWTVSAKLRGMVGFRCADLRVPTLQSYDLVLLRNVLLYLPPAERARVLAGLYLAMRPGARLVLGVAEQVEESIGLFEAHIVDDCCFYTAVSA